MLRTLARRPKRFLKRTASFLMGAAVVLLYHRVYDTDFDPLLLSVSPDNFDAQMTYLRRRYALLSLDGAPSEPLEREACRAAPWRSRSTTATGTISGMRGRSSIGTGFRRRYS